MTVRVWILAAQMRRDGLRVRDLVVVRVVESNGDGQRRPRARLHHVGDHCGGVDASGQECAERHVAYLPERDGLTQEIVELLEVVFLAAAVLVTRKLQIPVPERADRSLFGHEHMRRRQLRDVTIDRAGRGNVEQRQVGIDRVGTPFARHVRILEERFQLGPEDHARARQLGVVERLDAEAIACEHEPSSDRIPDRKGEHAAEFLHAQLAPFLVAVDDDLGVGFGAEAVAVRDQLRANRGEVVDLAVEDGPDGAILVAQGLIPR